MIDLFIDTKIMSHMKSKLRLNIAVAAHFLRKRRNLSHFLKSSPVCIFSTKMRKLGVVLLSCLQSYVVFGGYVHGCIFQNRVFLIYGSYLHPPVDFPGTAPPQTTLFCSSRFPILTGISAT